MYHRSISDIHLPLFWTILMNLTYKIKFILNFDNHKHTFVNQKDKYKPFQFSFKVFCAHFKVSDMHTDQTYN